MLHKFKGAVHVLGNTNPEVISSHGILDSISSIVKLCYQNSELAIHISIVLHVFNGSQLTSFKGGASNLINARKCEIHYLGESEKTCTELQFI